MSGVAALSTAVGSSSADIGASGTNRDNAAVIANTGVLVSTVAPGQGVRLPTTPAPGAICYVHNGSAASLQVYSAAGSTLNDTDSSIGLSMAAHTGIFFWAIDTMTWYGVYLDGLTP